MAKLYPPIVENTLDAFYGNSITVPFTLNRAVGINQVSGFSLVVKSTVTNDVIYSTTTSTVSSTEAIFSLGAATNFKAGGFYKIQIAFIDQAGTTGFYSGAAVAKYIGSTAPTVEIIDNRAQNDVFLGIYNPQEDITEKLYSYSFTLVNEEGVVVEDTGEQLHNSAEDIGLQQIETYTPNIAFSGEGTYTLTFTITTINGFTTSKTELFYGSKDDSGYIPRNMELSAQMDSENGCMVISVRSIDPANTRQLIYGKFEIYKLSSKDNFAERYRIAYFQLQNQDIFDKTFKDFTVEAGVYYRYVLVQRNDYGIFSEDIWNVEGSVYAQYDHLFLFDGIRQLKIKFNPQVSSFKNTIYETKTDTIGGQYPFIFRNANTKYKEFSLSGLISYQMDEQNLFLNDDDYWLDIEQNESAKDKWTTSSLNVSNFTAEREFKLKVLDWLNNGQVKLFKSPAEGNYIVRLLNVSLTPETAVGRMLHTFTATGYEVEDVNEYQFCQALTIDKTNTYIGYATTPLYDWPNYRIWSGQKLNIDNTEYEIIGSPNLEYVTGVQFEDIKPGTFFKVTLERDNQEMIYEFQIGATGFYVIPSELGFHIKRIRLKASKWEVGDWGKDIINNRGQVTYIYERQAKHNNFNDITEIRSNFRISNPIYPTEFSLTVETPLTTIDGTPVYEYQKIADDPGWVEVAYFEGNNTPKVRGLDYEIEDDIYYSLNSNGTINKTNPLTLAKDSGFPYVLGEQVPSYKIAEDPLSTVEGVDYQYLPQGKTYYYNKIGENAIDKTTVPASIKINNTKKVPLFLQQYDSKGVAIMTDVEELLEDSSQQIYYQNPYYSQVGKTQAIIIKIVDNESEKTTSTNIVLSTSDGSSYGFESMTIQDTSGVLVKSRYYSNKTISSNSISGSFSHNEGNSYSLTFYYDTASTNVTGRANCQFNFNIVNNNGNISITSGTSPQDNLSLPPWGDTIESISSVTQSVTPDVYVNLYKLVPVVNVTVGENSQVSIIREHIVQKNFIPNKYYNVTNIDGEYYLKEEIQNIYQMSFELIEVFYDQKDFSGKFQGNGTVSYTDVVENAGYSRTTRLIKSGLNNRIQITSEEDLKNYSQIYDENNKIYNIILKVENGENKYIIQDTNNNEVLFESQKFYVNYEPMGDQIYRADDEVYYDDITITDPSWNGSPNSTTIIENEFTPVASLWNNGWQGDYYKLYGLTDNDLKDKNGLIDVLTLVDFIFKLYPKVDIYYQQGLGGASGLYKYSLISKIINNITQDAEGNNVVNYNLFFYGTTGDTPDLENVNLNPDLFFVNFKLQGYYNYIKRTTPKRNQLMIVFTDSPNHIETIDLTHRLSYQISADDVGNEDLQNIAAVYLGENVRGFLTYKRKQYSYQALVDDSISIELTPDIGLVEGTKE